MLLEDEPAGAVEVVVLSPPGNPAAFDEAEAFTPRDMKLHDVRFRERSVDDVHELVRMYREELPDEILGRLDSGQLSAMFVACTGMSYGYAPAVDRSYWKELEDSSGMAVATATRAVEELWDEQGYDSMVLVSPYDDRSTAEAEEYWSQAGYPVRQVVRVRGGHPYRVTSEDLERALRHERLEPGVPILLSGTGMRTRDSLGWIEALHGAPVWSVNLAGARWLVKATK